MKFLLSSEQDLLQIYIELAESAEHCRFSPGTDDDFNDPSLV